MKNFTTKGLTLIELLVVITLLSILAAGVNAVYSSAQQKSRDSIRQNDLLAVRSAVEQSFGDSSEYPKAEELSSKIVDTRYIQSLPKDPKTNQVDDETAFVYVYGSSKSSITDVAGQEYELSANFENEGNAETKEIADFDGGDDDTRWEIGIGVQNVCTTWTVSNVAGTCDTDNDWDNDGTADLAEKMDGDAASKSADGNVGDAPTGNDPDEYNFLPMPDFEGDGSEVLSSPPNLGISEPSVSTPSISEPSISTPSISEPSISTPSISGSGGSGFSISGN
jgi:general secretion pathway protein G